MSGNLSDLGFNANNVAPSSFEPIPAGWYNVAIVDSVVEHTKAGTGKYLQLEFQVLSGPCKGRKLFDRLNMWNPSPKAVEIAKAQFSSICRAVCILTPQNSSELHNKPLQANVVVTHDEQYGDRNEIRGYKPHQAMSPGQLEVVAALENPQPPNPDDPPF